MKSAEESATETKEVGNSRYRRRCPVRGFPAAAAAHLGVIADPPA